MHASDVPGTQAGNKTVCGVSVPVCVIVDAVDHRFPYLHTYLTREHRAVTMTVSVVG